MKGQMSSRWASFRRSEVCPDLLGSMDPRGFCAQPVCSERSRRLARSDRRWS